MVGYYKRADVRRAILDFACESSGNPIRECAFYNRKIRSMQRYLTRTDAEMDRPMVLDSTTTLELALRAGATAFYASYWRYAYPRELRYPIGHDLVWTVRALRGGLQPAKRLTSLVIEALADGGLEEPWIKYSGQLGFDLIIPLEAIPADAWRGDAGLLADLQQALTRYVVDYLTERQPDFRFDVSKSRVTIKFEGNTCLLSELRRRRGLLLAPMSLCPSSGLVSTPLAPGSIPEFSALGASPSDVIAYKWTTPGLASGLFRLVEECYSPLHQEIGTAQTLIQQYI